MKRCGRMFGVLAVCLTLAMTLCACGGAQKLPGVWQGSGDLDILGMEAPFEFAEQWIFEDEGRAVAVIGGEQVEFTYSTTDDTLTLSDGEMSWGILYEVRGNTLTLETGGGNAATFSKVR